MKRRLGKGSPFALALALVVFAANAPSQTPAKKPEMTASGVAAQNPFDAFKHFSAVMNGGIIADKNRKIYRSGKLMRTDFQDQYRVTDIEVPITWVVFNKTGTKPETCARFDVADADTYPFWGLDNFRVERVPAAEPAGGNETVDGHACQINHLIFVNSKSHPPVTMDMRLWEAEDLKGFPIKIEVHNSITNRTLTISYSDVSLEPPDPKLFVRSEKCGGADRNVQTGTEPSKIPDNPAPTPSPQ
jgi:hypothetical protein